MIHPIPFASGNFYVPEAVSMSQCGHRYRTFYVALDGVHWMCNECCTRGVSGAPLDTLAAMSEPDNQPDIPPLDKVKMAIMELSKNEQFEIYKFLNALGHRING